MKNRCISPLRSLTFVCLVTAAGDESPSEGSGESAVVAAVVSVIVVSVIVVVVLIIVLLGVVRKRAHGTTWFPEGFCVFGRSVFNTQTPRYT